MSLTRKMKAPKVLFLQGSWEGHKPEQIIHKFNAALLEQGCQTEAITSLKRLVDMDWLKTFDVISPCWTMGSLSPEESAGLRDAVRAGVGLGGIHGGMGDAFRGDERRAWDFRSPDRGDIRFEDVIVALNDIRYNGPLSVEWEDIRMDRIHGATEVAAFANKLDFAPSAVAFDAAFEKKSS